MTPNRPEYSDPPLPTPPTLGDTPQGWYLFKTSSPGAGKAFVGRASVSAVLAGPDIEREAHGERPRKHQTTYITTGGTMVRVLGVPSVIMGVLYGDES